jgi:hypothetical protein
MKTISLSLRHTTKTLWDVTAIFSLVIRELGQIALFLWAISPFTVIFPYLLYEQARGILATHMDPILAATASMLGCAIGFALVGLLILAVTTLSVLLNNVAAIWAHGWISALLDYLDRREESIWTERQRYYELNPC